MKTFSEFLEERRKTGTLSGTLATLALLVHGGKEVYNEITVPGYLRDLSSNQHYMDLTNSHGHNAGDIINPNNDSHGHNAGDIINPNKEEKNKEEENDESTRRP